MNVSRSTGLTLALAVGLSLAQEPAPTAFRGGTELVLVPFHVSRGNRFVSDLQRGDVVLLEDGRQREFSVFQGAEERLPLELILLFDTQATTLILGNRRQPADRPALKFRYDFVNHWDESMSRAVLVRNGWDIRVKVYHFDRQALQRICPATSDPKEFLGAFRRLLDPISGNAIPLTLPTGRTGLKKFGMPDDWPLEAAIATLKDAAAVPGKGSRMLVVFSEGIGNTSTVSADVADAANALGVPVYPVALTYQTMVLYSRMALERNPETGESKGTLGGQAYYRDFLDGMEDFRKLGPLTGGRSFEARLPNINTGDVRDILEAVLQDGASQYGVGFAPTASGSLKAHKLEVKLAPNAKGSLTGGKRTVVY